MEADVGTDGQWPSPERGIIAPVSASSSGWSFLMFNRDSFFLARLVNGSMNEDRARGPGGAVAAIPAGGGPSVRCAGPRATFDLGRLPGGASAACARSRSGDHGRTRSPGQVDVHRDVSTCDVEWLWTGRVPLGMLTMFAGDPKLGKSYVTLAMAAAVSRGRPLPLSGLPDRPGSVILMSAEDDLARTIVPRLTAAGADLAKVHVLESVILADGAETLPNLRPDVDAITAAATGLGDCRLIVVDPVSAYLKGVDDNRNAVLRSVLTPLKTLAERLNAAVVLVSHLTKGTTGNGKHRVLGSIAYVGASRATICLSRTPAIGPPAACSCLDNGGNLAPPAPTLSYVIEDRGGGAHVSGATSRSP